MASALAAVVLSGLTAGCEKKEESKAKEAADAGALDAGPAQPVIGGKLGEVVAEAASGSPAAPAAPAASGDAANTPPPNGVFTLQRAAAALPKDVPYKLDLIDEGSEPRRKLAVTIDPKSEQQLLVTLGLRMGGPQGLPRLEFGLSLKADKPKEGEAAIPVTAKITSATLASMSLGGPPKELSAALAKLKGSSLRYELSPANVASNFQPELATGTDPGFAPIIAALGEAIGLLTPPLPDKPVGAGAYWMVADRAVASGANLPVLRYRVYKIDKVEGDTVSFTVDTRQYAEGADFKLPGPTGDMTMTIEQLESTGKGSLTWSPSSVAAGTADITQRLQAILVPPGGQRTAQRSVAQVDLTAKLAPPVEAAP